MSSVTNSQSTSLSTNNSGISDVQEAIRIKHDEYAYAVEELTSLLEDDDAESESVHERVESFIDHKVGVVMGLIEQMKLSDEQGVALRDDFETVIDKATQGLSEELQHLKEVLKKTQADVSKAKNELVSMKKQMEILNTAVENRAETGEMYALESLEEKARKAERAFRNHKKRLDFNNISGLQLTQPPIQSFGRRP